MPKIRQKEHKGNNRQILCRPRSAGVSLTSIFLVTNVTMNGTTVPPYGTSVRYGRTYGTDERNERMVVIRDVPEVLPVRAVV